MATRVTLTKTDKRILVNKVVLSGDRDDRKAEARWLAEAHHSGVVKLDRWLDEPQTIITEHAGTDTLRTRPTTPPQAAVALAQVCTTLATLHGRSLIHNNLTLDHIILSGTDPVSTALCSPRGGCNEPAADLDALAACIRLLLERWDAQDVKVSSREVWEDLEQRLRQHNGPFGATRAAGILARLAERKPQSSLTKPAGSRPRHKFLGAGVATTFVCLCLAGLLALRPQQEADGPMAELVVGTSRFATGTNGDLALALGAPCLDGPVAALLDSESATVWGFYASVDGEAGTALATVHGATAIETRQGDDCDELWATGPAGATLVYPTDAAALQGASGGS